MNKKNPKLDKDFIIYNLYDILNEIYWDLNFNVQTMPPKTIKSLLSLARERAGEALDIEDAAKIYNKYKNGEE